MGYYYPLQNMQQQQLQHQPIIQEEQGEEEDQMNNPNNMVHKGEDTQSQSQSQSVSKSNREIVNRRRYSDSEKETIIRIYQLYDVKEAALTIIKSIPTFDKIERNMIKRWIKKDKMVVKLGRPVDYEFERDILQMCVKEAEETGSRPEDAMFSYSTVRRCAIATTNAKFPDEHGNMVQKWALYQQKLKFSNKWVNGFIRRLREVQECQNIAAAASAAASAAVSSSSAGDGLSFHTPHDGSSAMMQGNPSGGLLHRIAMYGQNSQVLDDDDDDDDDDDLRLPDNV